MTTEISRKDVEDAIARAGIKSPDEMMQYIADPSDGWKAKVRSAVTAGDDYALSCYCAMAVSDRLKRAGADIVLDARTLKAISSSNDGWGLLSDVASKRENAAQILMRRIAAFREASGQAVDDVPPHKQDSPSRAEQNRAYERPHPPPRRHDTSDVRQIGDARRARERRQQAASSEPEQNSVESEWDSVKVHGGKAALTIEATQSRRGSPTINIEAARMKDRESRTYDWSNKIILQLTSAELQQVTLLLCGKLQHVKFQNHGRDNDKWFEIERQTGQYAGTIKFAVGQGKDVCLVQLTPADLGNVVGLFIRQCARQMRVEQSALGMALAPVAQALNEQAQSRNGGGQRRSAG